jgi:fucose permease
VFQSGKRWTAYFLVAAGITVVIGWYFANVAECTESDTGRCEVGTGAVLTTAIVLGLVMPVVMLLSELMARDRRKRDRA